jgi:DNA-binding MarR family transcriptional regulator
MSDPQPSSDDGSLKPEHDGGEESSDADFSLDVDLPDQSFLTLEEYLEMFKTASSEPAFKILCALQEYTRLSTSELSMVVGREDNDLHYYLRKLKRVGLVVNRRDPNTGTEETYSYYELTDMGELVLTEGIATGVKKIAQDEATLSENYCE